MASTQVSTPSSLAGTPRYIQQQEQPDEVFHFPREQLGESRNLTTEEGNENPMNTLAALSESRLPFQTEQASNGAGFAFQQSDLQQSSKVDLNSTNNNEDSGRKFGSKRWRFGTNKSLCTASDKVGKKPRPRGYYSVNNNSDLSFLETPSISTYSSVAKTEPLLISSEPRSHSNMVPSMFVPSSSMVNSSIPMANADSSRTNVYRRSTILEDSSKHVTTYPNRGFSYMSQSARPIQGSCFRRQLTQSLEDTMNSDRNALNSLPAETPSQRRERRKLARAQVRAANQLQKRQARDRLKSMEQVAHASKPKNIDNVQASTVSPSEEFSYASSRQEDTLTEETKDVLDPKAIRAIRNREAALRSRQQAKARLKALETENAEFQQKVNLLERENMELRQELEKFKAFLQQKNVRLEHTEASCRATDF
ncbi:hypothetical protein GpartN1_g6820.t1 [Galdieria partita]|uniref:BZIP domain-containing protein n=1 Tax=Galdieria partita TaxID=83374 RepID=A0A9C7Q2A6_9RHOD|nr:hypothetical protein GpartN1_g6820.t1 [Galdieria partita]